MVWILIISATLFVAYANGANDNFKGVATLFGSGTTDYRKALAWATVTTLAGSLAAFFLAAKLIKTFSGKGLVPDAFVSNPVFIASVILGAGLTIFVAAKTGIPISTTHGLTGALVGSGLVAVGTGLGFSDLGKSFFVPLLASPLIAVALTVMVYPLFQLVRRFTGVKKNTCLCVGERVIPVGNVAVGENGILSVSQLKSLDVILDEKSVCQVQAVEVYSGSLAGIEIQGILDFLHFLSAGAVSFARGLNDTPKIVALSVAAGMLGLKWNIALVAIAIALGGIVSARKVAETMSLRITGMNHGQGFTANLITAVLVIFASRWGLPVSTTHVACGALFGIGIVNGKARWKTISGILLAWFLTLPMAALLAGVFYFILQKAGL
ncbi:MAG: inorganic phosphate transporter [Candidatus Omnitrophica bacterium]|nr:inorganic phosphate transporter [Candidatus Omnitrophota bacterium]